MKRYFVFSPPKITLNILSDHNAGLPVSIYFTLFVYFLPRAFSLFCTHPAHNRVKRLWQGVSCATFGRGA